MTAYNAGRSSQSGESGSDNASQYSFDSSAVNSEQTENERLRNRIKSLRAELHTTTACLEQAQYAAARQKRLTELKVSLVVSGLGGGQYAGYENGRVIYRWEREQRRYLENASQRERERLRLEAIRQDAQQRSEARLRAVAGLDAWTQAPFNSSARRQLI